MIRSFNRFLVCWYQASDKPLPTWLQRACDRDPQLSHELAAEDALTRRLRTDPRPPVIEASPYLASRITHATRAPMARHGFFALRRGFQMAALTGGVCFALIIFSRWARPLDPKLASVETPASEVLNQDQRTEMRSELLTTPAAAVLAGASATNARLSPVTAWSNPLDQEVNHVIADAKGVVRFLAGNFIPQTTLAEKKSG